MNTQQWRSVSVNELNSFAGGPRTQAADSRAQRHDSRAATSVGAHHRCGVAVIIGVVTARAQPFVAFPPGSRHVVVPLRPRRASVNGLRLYEATSPTRRAAAAGARGLARLGAGTAIGLGGRVALQDAAWWQDLRARVAEPLLGPLPGLAVRHADDRCWALLMSRDGQPRAFVKVRPSEQAVSWEPDVLHLLAVDRPAAFRVPRLLADGTLGGRHYRILEPLPEGGTRPPPYSAARVAGVVDELQRRLAPLARPADVPDHHVPGHGDFTPWNLRRAGGDLWLFDWEDGGWAPRLADEVRFWAAVHASRRLRSPARAARELLALLLRRGTPDEVGEAAAWPEWNRPSERQLRQALLALLADPARATA